MRTFATVLLACLSTGLIACTSHPSTPAPAATPATTPAPAAATSPKLTGVWQVEDERRSGIAIFADDEAFEIDVHTCQWMSHVPFTLTRTDSETTFSRDGAPAGSLRLEGDRLRIAAPDGQKARYAVRSTKCPLPSQKPAPGSVPAP